MMTPTHDAAQEITKIEADFPGWAVFQSDAGRLWASDREITHAQVQRGYATTVDADGPDELRAALHHEQQARAELAPGPVSVAP